MSDPFVSTDSSEEIDSGEYVLPSAFTTVFQHPTTGRPFLLTGVIDDSEPPMLEFVYQDGANETGEIPQDTAGVTEYGESTSESSSGI
jgi:hypothetical protein